MKLLFSLASAVVILLIVPTTASSECIKLEYPGSFGHREAPSIHNRCDECRKVLIKTINCFGEKSKIFKVERNSSKRITTKFAQPASPSGQIQCMDKLWTLGEERPCSPEGAAGSGIVPQRDSSRRHAETASPITRNADDSEELSLVRLYPDAEGRLPSNVVARCLLGTRDLTPGEREHILNFVPTDRDGPTLSEILNSTSGVDVFNASGHIAYELPILKANTIVFRPGSVLEWTDIHAPLWLMVANTVHFQGRVTITRAPVRIAKPPEPRSVHGKPSYIKDRSMYGRVVYVGENDLKRNKNRKGRSGGHGNPGLKGTPGATSDLPCLVLIANTLVFGTDASLRVDLVGIDGGDGGDGGGGGYGGHGENGANASANIYKCRREPQDGGPGGNGGDGGRGGAAGNGGKGVDIVYVGHRSDGELFMRNANIHNEGGSPGESGAGGVRGKGGWGGWPGHRGLRPCFRRTSRGRIADHGNNGPDGDAGHAGARGLERTIELSPDQLNRLLASVGVLAPEAH